MIEIHVSNADTLIAARLIVAVATNDGDQLKMTLHDAATNSRPGGVMPILLAMASSTIVLARALDGDEYLESLRAAVLALTLAVEDEQQSS